MNPEIPAEGISVTRRFEDSIFYKVDCQCGNNDDEINFEIEIDEEMQDISLKQWTVQKTNWWSEFVKPHYDIDNDYAQGLNWLWTGFVNGLITRLRLTKHIWWDGYVRYESYTILNKQQALNYAEALKQAVEHLEQVKQSKNKTTP